MLVKAHMAARYAVRMTIAAVLDVVIVVKVMFTNPVIKLAWPR